MIVAKLSSSLPALQSNRKEKEASYENYLKAAQAINWYGGPCRGCGRWMWRGRKPKYGLRIIDRENSIAWHVLNLLIIILRTSYLINKYHYFLNKIFMWTLKRVFKLMVAEGMRVQSGSTCNLGRMTLFTYKISQGFVFLMVNSVFSD